MLKKITSFFIILLGLNFVALNAYAAVTPCAVGGVCCGVPIATNCQLSSCEATCKAAFLAQCQPGVDCTSCYNSCMTACSACPNK